ncbi:MAG: FAD-binding oxidoreductase, partial [Actinomycetota bacterium]|nr:FAD-binding oxidoreductase [Actinomycetota bacterium]
MSLADQLSEFLDADLITTSPADRARHARDLSPGALIAERKNGARPGPEVVVRPQRTPQVAEILFWAHRTGTPVYPYGAGSGVCDGIAPHGGIVVDLSDMDQILDVDEKSRLVRAQAGVMGSSLSVELGTRGLTLGHEPQSLAISTVGGWVATRASGQLSARYGGIEKMVAGLE